MRVVLLGMNNPLRAGPKYALFPAPAGCTGHRIYQLLRSKLPHLLRQDYLNGFERVNLVDSKLWSRRAAQQAAPGMVQRMAGRTVVTFGEEVRLALGLPKLLLHPQQVHGVTWRQLPHPSGRNLWYNDEKNRDLAATLLAELYMDGQRG